jgi:hypothetical protein
LKKLSYVSRLNDNHCIFRVQIMQSDLRFYRILEHKKRKKRIRK